MSLNLTNVEAQPVPQAEAAAEVAAPKKLKRYQLLFAHANLLSQVLGNPFVASARVSVRLDNAYHCMRFQLLRPLRRGAA